MPGTTSLSGNADVSPRTTPTASLWDCDVARPSRRFDTIGSSLGCNRREALHCRRVLRCGEQLRPVVGRIAMHEHADEHRVRIARSAGLAQRVAIVDPGIDHDPRRPIGSENQPEPVGAEFRRHAIINEPAGGAPPFSGVSLLPHRSVRIRTAGPAAAGPVRHAAIEVSGRSGRAGHARRRGLHVSFRPPIVCEQRWIGEPGAQPVHDVVDQLHDAAAELGDDHHDLAP